MLRTASGLQRLCAGLCRRQAPHWHQRLDVGGPSVCDIRAGARPRRRHPAHSGIVLSYVTKMGVSSSVVEAMSETSDVRWLGAKEASAMNLVTDPVRGP